MWPVGPRKPVEQHRRRAREEAPTLHRPEISERYLRRVLRKLLAIPSPSGYTDRVVRFVAGELDRLGITYELTRRGAIRATIPGERAAPSRALVAHLDTLGAMVTRLKENGRLAIRPIGHWSSRFAEGARVTLLTDEGSRRGTIMLLKSSGHTSGEAVDTQPVSWDQLEIRVDSHVENEQALLELGMRVGDFVAIDPATEFTEAGYVVSRHLDDKAGAAALLAAARATVEGELRLPITCHLLFTIFEEVGSGASGVLHGDVAEMVAIDNATTAPGQASTERDVTIAMMDSSGPFDYHLSHKLIGLAGEHSIPYRRDTFRYYRCDAASAVEAGNDIRVALASFGVDGSHGWERTHLDSVLGLAGLCALYMQSEATFQRDRMDLGPLKGFPHQPQ